MNNKDTNLIWLDLEMTGLNVDNERIIEIATIVTDAQLNIIAEGPALVVHQSDDLLASMDEWCTKQHGESGLTERVRKSKITEVDAEEATLKFLYQHANPKKSPICGNSIWQDRKFLCRYMPELESFFHYRNVDVSTLKELVARWYPNLTKFDKKSKHLALSDVCDSIDELKYYRQEIFK